MKWNLAASNGLTLSVPGVYRLVGLVVKVSALRAEGPRFDPRLRRGSISGLSHTSAIKLALQWIPTRRLGV